MDSTSKVSQSGQSESSVQNEPQSQSDNLDEFDQWASVNPPKQTDLNELKQKISYLENEVEYWAKLAKGSMIQSAVETNRETNKCADSQETSPNLSQNVKQNDASETAAKTDISPLTYQSAQVSKSAQEAGREYASEMYDNKREPEEWSRASIHFQAGWQARGPTTRQVTSKEDK